LHVALRGPTGFAAGFAAATGTRPPLTAIAATNAALPAAIAPTRTILDIQLDLLIAISWFQCSDTPLRHSTHWRQSACGYRLARTERLWIASRQCESCTTLTRYGLSIEQRQ
jgi:hypothetical protein